MKGRESILYGRVEMLALKACAYLHMKNLSEAVKAFREAYKEAEPNNIITPFIELGRDMRTLTSAAIRGPNSGIPGEWLEMVKRKSASFAKYQSAMISDFEKAGGYRHSVILSERENKVLSDLYHGLSRAEIASGQKLSVNTVNSVVNSIFNKLGARGIADAVRIAAEENLLGD
jgi:LuxR family maltose regulon positive regulatory protein